MTTQMDRRTFLALAGAGAAALRLGPARGQDGKRGGGGRDKGGRGGGGRGGQRSDPPFPPESAALRELSLVLGRPTDRSITVNVLAWEAAEAYFEYGCASDSRPRKTDTIRLPAGRPVEAVLDGLQPDTRYAYRMCRRPEGAAAFAAGPEYAFHTRRAPGSTFTFEIQGDSHPERPQQFDPALYVRTLQGAASDKPDFYLTSGDDFSVDTLQTVNAETVAHRYFLQRMYLGLLAPSCPIFLVNGNHEQAAACNLNGTPDNVAVWAQKARNLHYPQPAPDGFYTGNARPVEFIGLLRNYYAWTWGDALFAVIDPYWHSSKPVDNAFGTREKQRDLWAITLGDEQYQWLRKTLEDSKAKYKFVFAHHVLGTGRGGIEQAGLYEWGGRNKKGDWEFSQKRPGWELPIHQLMARTGVTIFFQGHDHIFVRQELDGVVYQSLPEPADPNYTLYNKEAYRTGDALPNSGRVRVTVSPAKVRVEYVRSYLPKDATAQHPDGEVAFRYEIPVSRPAPKASARP